MSYTLSQAGAQMIGQFEGLRLTAYYDQVNVLTIGYGTTNAVLPASMKFGPGTTITAAQALQYLQYAVNTTFAPKVNAFVKVAINQNQFDSLVSFAYNLGAGNLGASTLLRMLNAGNFAGAQQQFLLWNKAGGVVARGLTNRRLSEATNFGPLCRADLIAQCLNGVDPSINPNA
jgi:lysozyme